MSEAALLFSELGAVCRREGSEVAISYIRSLPNSAASGDDGATTLLQRVRTCFLAEEYNALTPSLSGGPHLLGLFSPAFLSRQPRIGVLLADQDRGSPYQTSLGSIECPPT